MRILAISTAYDGGSAAILAGETILVRDTITKEIGLAAALPPMLNALLDTAGRALDAVAVVTGPGSFTGLRAGISVATGIALALGLPIIGVTAAEALAAGLPPLPGRALWTAIQARPGRIFLDQGEGAFSCLSNAIPLPVTPIATCGNAAAVVAASLAARGANVMLTDARAALPEWAAAVAARRLAGNHPPPMPLYVDAAEAKLPAGGLRPAPI